MHDVEKKEQERLLLQERLDNVKTQQERNRLGQFATPTALALDILQYAKKMMGEERVPRFLDPALGTGSFYSAFLRIFGGSAASHATGFEIDRHYGETAVALWSEHGLDIHLEDFTRAKPPEDEERKATLVICNPPYVRHHHIASDEKKRLSEALWARQGLSLSGLSGLYCYFLCLSREWMAHGGLAAWLIPSEFMDVNYGKAIKDFLLDKVSLLHIHRFAPEDVQFGDALVSSAIVWFKNETPLHRQCVKFSFGGSLSKPLVEKAYPIDELRQERKWTGLPRTASGNGNGHALPVVGDFFIVKRGIATGANEFFILSPSEVVRRAIPSKFLTPILPSPRYLKANSIECDEDGIPKIDRIGYLFSSDIPEECMRREFPEVWKYLQEGRELGIPERYICRNRNPWYSQERRETAPLLCTYMGRNGRNGDLRPFRFILNRSRAIAANVYLMLYPKSWLRREFHANPATAEKVWSVLQAIPIETLLGEGRVYGGGLHKMEPKELLNAPAEDLCLLFPHGRKSSATQITFF